MLPPQPSRKPGKAEDNHRSAIDIRRYAFSAGEANVMESQLPAGV
jgi:hypothetical protein